MTDAQIAEIAGRIVAAIPKPADDYCLFGAQIWWLCMSKAEWASWLQVFVATIGIFAAIRVVRYQMVLTRRAGHEGDASRLRARANLLTVAVDAARGIDTQHRAASPPAAALVKAFISDLDQVKRVVDRLQWETITNIVEMERLLHARGRLDEMLQLVTASDGLSLHQRSVLAQCAAALESDSRQLDAEAVRLER